MGVGKNTRISNKKEANEVLQKIQDPIVYELEPRKEALPLLKRIPFLSRFVKNSGEVGNEVMQLSSALNGFTHAPPPAGLTISLQFGAISLAALDFFLIPIVYLAAFLLKEKVPFTLNNNARLAYSAVLMALTITAIAVPVTAPIIALVTAGLTLGLSAFLLGKALHERYLLGKERGAIRRALAFEEEEMQRIQDEAQLLQTNLNSATDEQHLHEIYTQIMELHERYEAQLGRMKSLKEDELTVNAKLKKFDFIHILDKGLATSFASIAVIGFVVSLFFPLAGFGILATVSLVSLGYLLTRIATPLFRSLANWINPQAPTPIDIDEHLDLSVGPQAANTADVDLAALQKAQQESDSHKSMLQQLFAFPKKVAAAPLVQAVTEPVQEEAVSDKEEKGIVLESNTSKAAVKHRIFKMPTNTETSPETESPEKTNGNVV